MKRPQGFDRPRGEAEAREADVSVAPPPASRSGAPGRARTAAASAAPGSSAADRLGTEPIPVVSAPPSRLPSARFWSPRPDADPDAGVAIGDSAGAGSQPDAAAPGWDATPAETAPLPPADGAHPAAAPDRTDVEADAVGGSSARAVRAAARRAAAGRRRYERAEVRRFTRRSRHRRLAWLIGGGTTVLVLGGLVGAAYSPLMALRDIDIEGASAVSADDLRAALSDELGTPLPLLDDARVHAAIAGFSLVERYSTELVPPGTLVVRIVERRAIGALPGNGGWDLVDAAGVVMSHSDAPPDGQPTLDVPDGIASEEFTAVGAVIRSLPDPVRSRLTAVSAESPGDVRLSLEGGAKVVWGDETQPGLKSTVLADLVAAAPPDTVAEYDVSAPMSPVTR